MVELDLSINRNNFRTDQLGKLWSVPERRVELAGEFGFQIYFGNEDLELVFE